MSHPSAPPGYTISMPPLRQTDATPLPPGTRAHDIQTIDAEEYEVTSDSSTSSDALDASKRRILDLPIPASRLFQDTDEKDHAIDHLSSGVFTAEPIPLSTTQGDFQRKPVAEPKLASSMGGRPAHPRTHHRATVPPISDGHASGSIPSGVRAPRRWETMRTFSERAASHHGGPKGPWQSGTKFRFPLSKSQEDGHWETHYSIGRDYDKERCAAWKEEITQLIIVVALLAATVVAFLSISLSKLKEDPDAIYEDYMRHMVTQFDRYFAALQNDSIATANFTIMPARSAYKPPSSVIRQNGAMLLSVTVSLSAVLIGAICLQWLRGYECDTRLGPKEGAALRQMKHDGFNYWRVPLIISWLPVLLQLAVGIFFWGLIELLWGLNHTLSTINLVAIGFTVTLVLATTLAPAVQNLMIGENWIRGPQVPYKSFLARCCAIVVLFLASATMYLLRPKFEEDPHFTRKRRFIRKVIKSLTETSVDDWVAYDMVWQGERMVPLSRISGEESEDVPRVIEWVATTHVASQRAIAAIYGAIRDMYPSTSMQVLRRLLTGGARGRPNAKLVERVNHFANEWKLELITPEQIDEGVEDVLTDMKSAMVLDKLVKNNPALRTALLDIRTELFVRILNHNSVANIHRTLNVWDIFDEAEDDPKAVWTMRLLVPFSKSKMAEDYLLIPDDLKVQILSTFKAYLLKREYRDILWEVTLSLVLKILTCQSEASTDLLSELGTLPAEITRFYKKLRDHDMHHAKAYTRLMDFVQSFGHSKAIREYPLMGPPSSSSASSISMIMEPDPCAGRSKGLFGHRLAQFEEGIEALKEAIGCPPGLDVYPAYMYPLRHHVST